MARKNSLLNLTKLRTSLNKCHITQKETLSFYEDCGSDYLITRAKEELELLNKEVSRGKTTGVELSTIRIVQLLTLLRVKIDGTLKTKE